MTRNAAISVLLVIAAALAGCDARGPRHNGTSVLLIVLDTVRADCFGSYHNTAGVTPEMDAIAERGVVFERCFANSSWTLPSHASLFTGLYPIAHGATQETLKLGPDWTTLAEVFRDAGYRTFGASSNPVVSVDRGLARGFDKFVEVFRDEFKLAANDSGPHLVNQATGEFFGSLRDGDPFFAFVNYIDAHWPYVAPEPFRYRFTDGRCSRREANNASRLVTTDHYMGRGFDQDHLDVARLMYHGEVAYLDSQVGDLVRMLETHDRARDTVVIITSDHGEQFGEHGHFGHRFSVYNTLLHVPLMVVRPGVTSAGERRRDVAQLLDLFPTVLAECGIHYRGREDGRNLFAQNADTTRAVAVAEYYYPRQNFALMKAHLTIAQGRGDDLVEKFGRFMRRSRAIQDDATKFIWGSDGRYELYAVGSDPGETVDVLIQDPSDPRRVHWESALDRFVQRYQGKDGLPPPPPKGWMMPGFEEEVGDPELVKKLRALGYIK